MDPPENATPTQREVYENAVRLSAPALGGVGILASAPGAVIKGQKTINNIFGSRLADNLAIAAKRYDDPIFKRDEIRQLIHSDAETLASMLRDRGFSVNVQHSGSAAGPSSYLNISDPTTGRFFTNPVRLSSHSKGPDRKSTRLNSSHT